MQTRFRRSPPSTLDVTHRAAGGRGKAGGVLAVLLSALSLGAAGAAGCGDTSDSRAASETAEALGAARQADSTPVSCVVLKRGLVKVEDTMLSSEKIANNYGGSTLAFVGQSASGPGDHFYALFKFQTSSIPAGATITSASVALSQIAPGPGTWNAHLITAPWNEGTVTWQSFGGAFSPTIFKSPSTATASVVFDIAPQLQAWVNGTVPNHGFLLEQSSGAQWKIKTSEFVVPGALPSLTACYKVSCAPHFADCNGAAADGCEADLHSVTTCGACGTGCALPHATASCATGSCAVGACDLGWSDCDGNPQNGCETDLSTTTNCGACGAACALPLAAVSCAGGSCKAVGCTGASFDCDGNPQNGCEPTPCADGAHCLDGSTCASQVCAGGFCTSPACNDHAKNGSETDTDCGGSCPPCADGLACGAGSDCQNAVCQGGSCAPPTCVDGVKNGSETDTDCGGGCSPCSDTQPCAIGADCTSSVCLGGVCHAATCSDGVKNGSETAADCGGACGPCANGVSCAASGDCASHVCTAQICQIPSCSDGVKNGGETDLDCGGSCPDCSDNQACSSSADCVNGVCNNGTCKPATCTDGVKNGNETGVDCGGACAVPEVCNGVDDDCNGSTDEGLGSTTCGLGACQVTVQNCVGGQVQSCIPGAPKAEICDGQLDDDCDGVVDNGCECVNGATQGCYTGSLATQNVGLCHGGVQMCLLGHWGACTGQVTPAAETCDGKDNNCNGQTDEGLGSTICGVGACQVMVQNCVAGAPQACSPGQPSAEICDGLDNDCNGQVDEGQPTQLCGSGACATSQPTCVNGAPAACNTHVNDGAACNDGHVCTVNDACLAGSCAGSLAPAGTLCRASAGACDPAESCSGAAQDCPADARSAAGTVCRASAGVCDVAETCNGASAACPSDGFTAAGTTVGACATGLLGVCSAGNSTCSGASATPSCVQITASSAEVCDSSDNNCNGTIDDGAAASCAARANATAACTSGACAYACNTGFGDCDGNTGTGCETDLKSSATSCGACGHACGVGMVCSNSTCVGSTLSLGYDFENNATDISGNGLNGTILGGASFAAGKHGQALTFSGGQVVDATTSNASPLIAMGTGSFTLAAWIRNTNAGGIWKRIITRRFNASGWYSLAVNSSRLRLELQGGLNYDSNAIVGDSLWHHVAAVRTNNGASCTIQLFVDGVLDNQWAGQGCVNVDNPGNILIGNWCDNNGNGCEAYDNGNFKGQIDDVRIYKAALSQAQVQSLL